MIVEQFLIWRSAPLASRSSWLPFSSAPPAPLRPSVHAWTHWPWVPRGSPSVPPRWSRWRSSHAHGSRPARGLILVAGACVAVYQLAFFAAVADTGVAVGTVVALGSAPAFTGLVARLFTGERLGRRWTAATALACAGVALLVLGSGAGGAVSAGGVGLALLAGAGYSGYAVASKRMLDSGARPEAVMAAVFGSGAVLLAPGARGGARGRAPHTRRAHAGPLPRPGADRTGLSVVARGLSRVGASEAATLTLAEPLTASLLGVVALGERPGLGAAAGAALILAGLTLLALPSRRPARDPARTEVSYASSLG